VVIGISLGGLITPVILKKYPHAKGVFIASNPTLRIEASRLAILIRIARHTNVLRVFGMLRYVPNNVLYWLYQRITPFTGMENERQVYREDMKRNILCIRRIPIHKEAEIVRFVAVTDNTELLKTIHNACVVFSGMSDVLMPVKKGKDLQSLLPNSRNIVSNGGHYNMVTKANISELDAFL
jgi:pimeloyl-ACP methyl ester carboxylesterase